MAKLFPHTIIQSLQAMDRKFDTVMRTHGPVDCKRAWDAYLAVPFSTRKTFISSLVNSLSDAIVFDFGELRPDYAHVDFATQICKHSDISEFPPTCFVTNSPGVRCLHMLEKAKGVSGFLYTYFAMPERADEELYIVPSATMIGATLEHYDGTQKSPGYAFKVGEIVVTAQEIVKVVSHLTAIDHSGTMIPIDVAKSRFNENISESFTEALGLYAMLSCREVEKVTVPAPVKLNKARTNAHKPPIKERTEIKINVSQPSLKVEYQTDDTISDRKSPRPHWRRGHPRRLPKSGIVKLIPPTWVLWDEDSPLPRPTIKNYKIT